MTDHTTSSPPNRRKPWATSDDDELRQRVSARQTASLIAKGMGRTVDGIRGRAQQLHISLPSSRQPWRVFARPSWWNRDPSGRD